MEYNPPCWNCTRYWPMGKGGQCAAFPDGIPEVIWHGLSAHERPLGGEKDSLLFEAADKKIGNPVRDEHRLKWGIETEYNPPCWNCTRYRKGQGGKCDAFPDGIPDLIKEGQHAHERPLGGEEDGLLFEAADKKIGNPVAR